MNNLKIIRNQYGVGAGLPYHCYLNKTKHTVKVNQPANITLKEDVHFLQIKCLGIFKSPEIAIPKGYDVQVTLLSPINTKFLVLLVILVLLGIIFSEFDFNLFAGGYSVIHYAATIFFGVLGYFLFFGNSQFINMKINYDLSKN